MQLDSPDQCAQKSIMTYVLAALAGMNIAISMAGPMGMGMVSVKHNNHFGMSAWVVQMAADHGLMSLVFTNSSPPLPAYGSRGKLLDLSPIACGASRGTGKHPFILDMALSCRTRKGVKSLETQRENSRRLGVGS